MFPLKPNKTLFQESWMLIKIQQNVTAGLTLDSIYIKTSNQQFKFSNFYRIYELKCHRERFRFVEENSLHGRELINELIYLRNNQNFSHHTHKGVQRKISLCNRICQVCFCFKIQFTYLYIQQTLNKLLNEMRYCV